MHKYIIDTKKLNDIKDFDILTTDFQQLSRYMVRQTFSRPDRCEDMNEAHKVLGTTWLKSDLNVGASGSKAKSVSISKHIKSLNDFINSAEVDISPFDEASILISSSMSLRKCLELCYDKSELEKNFPGARAFKAFETVTFGDLRSRSCDENLTVVLDVFKQLSTRSHPLLNYAGIQPMKPHQCVEQFTPYVFPQCLISKAILSPGLNQGVTSIGGFGTVS